MHKKMQNCIKMELDFVLFRQFKTRKGDVHEQIGKKF